MGLESQLIGLLIIAVLVATVARRFRVPYTVAMVVTGLGVGFLRLGPDLGYLTLSPHLILVTFLPGLLFEAGYHLDLRALRSNIRTILILAVPGVLLSMAIIGYLLHLLLGLPLADAMLFGILISATDPISVIALFKEMGVNKRLSVIVEGESLFNDGAAIVLYTILVGVASGEHTFSLSQSLTEFFVTVAGGAALGVVMGLIFGEAMKRTDDHLLDIALTTILAYGTYLLAADVLHEAVSPVIAVVVAAIYIGNYGARGEYSATSQVTIISFWEFVSFLLNSAIFLLIGLQIEPVALVSYAIPVGVAVGAVLLARAIVVYVLGFIVDRGVRPMPLSWAHVLVWGGLRGAVSMALALSLPATIRSRNLLEIMAFGYVLFSLILQGLTMRPLLNALGLTHISSKTRDFERRRARIAMSQAAIRAIDEMGQEHILTGPMCQQLRSVFEERIAGEWRDLEKLVAGTPSLVTADVRLVQHEIAGSQKQALMRLQRRGILSAEVYDEMASEIDERQARMDREQWQPPSVLVHGPEAYLPEDEVRETPLAPGEKIEILSRAIEREFHPEKKE
jgi:CPA1 family monovalent cation:H+ antiporter